MNGSSVNVQIVYQSFFLCAFFHLILLLVFNFFLIFQLFDPFFLK